MEIKMTVDTDDIYSDYDNGVSFEDLVKGEFRNEIKSYVFQRMSKTEIAQGTNQIQIECEDQIIDKMSNLVNEEISFTDQWGKPEFVGTVEDYIKKRIDEILLKPVDRNGKTTSSCSYGDDETWIKWHIRKSIKDQTEKIKRESQKYAKSFIENTLNQYLKDFTQNTLKGQILRGLESAGIK